MERENPEAMLEPEDLDEVQRGSGEIACDVCRAVSKVALQRAKKARALHDEERLSELVADLCVGTPMLPDGTYKGGEYPKYPGNPPLWGEMYRVRREAGGGAWRMKRLPKGATPEEKGGGDGDGGGEYNDMVIKHSMISRACKRVLSEEEELEPLFEVIYERGAQWTAQTLGASYCAPVCGGRGAEKQKEKEEL